MSRKFVLHSKKRNTLNSTNNNNNINNINNINNLNDLSKDDLLNFEKSLSKSRPSSSSLTNSNNNNNNKSISAPTSPNTQRKNLYAELFNSDNEDENSTSSNSNNSSNSDIPQANKKSLTQSTILKKQKYTIDELINLKHDKLLKFENLNYILNNLEYKKIQNLPMLSNSFLKKWGKSIDNSNNDSRKSNRSSKDWKSSIDSKYNNNNNNNNKKINNHHRRSNSFEFNNNHNHNHNNHHSNDYDDDDDDEIPEWYEETDFKIDSNFASYSGLSQFSSMDIEKEKLEFLEKERISTTAAAAIKFIK
ncbi:unnamed protein product [[Candida] boidinii]|uniref:Unnamed protein product n=1 Tax=Candida boidinii TaxID=5477 RepID=A0ACB5TRQ8_CANBO|nr:unnamed protein product [[Candida] boidinii]